MVGMGHPCWLLNGQQVGTYSRGVFERLDSTNDNRIFPSPSNSQLSSVYSPPDWMSMEEVETLTQEVLRIIANSPYYAVSLKVDFPANFQALSNSLVEFRIDENEAHPVCNKPRYFTTSCITLRQARFAAGLLAMCAKLTFWPPLWWKVSRV